MTLKNIDVDSKGAIRLIDASASGWTYEGGKLSTSADVDISGNVNTIEHLTLNKSLYWNGGGANPIYSMNGLATSWVMRVLNDDGSVHDYPIDITKASRGLINIGGDPTNPRPVKVGSDFTVSGLSGTRPQAIAANANGKLFRDTQTIYHNPQSVQVSSVTGVLNIAPSSGFYTGSFTFDALPYFKNARGINFEIVGTMDASDNPTQFVNFQLSITGDASITITSKQYEVTFGGANNFILSGAITMEADANPSFYNIVSYMKTSFGEDSISGDFDISRSGATVASSITDLTITLGAKILFSTYAPDGIAALRYKIVADPF